MSHDSVQATMTYRGGSLTEVSEELRDRGVKNPTTQGWWYATEIGKVRKSLGLCKCVYYSDSDLNLILNCILKISKGGN